MKKVILVSAALAVLLLAVSSSLFAQEKVQKKFSNLRSVKCDFALGDVTIKKSSDDQIHVGLTYTHDKRGFDPVITTRGGSLILKEKFSDGSDYDTGYSKWVISVPKDTEIDINTGTGDIIIIDAVIEVEANTGTGTIEIAGSKGSFDMNTGTGDVEVTNGNGEFDLNTGTGDVLIADTKGELKGNSGTGSVDAENITIDFEASFNSGTGNVSVTAPMGDAFELSLNSGTGNAVLNMDGQPLKGHFTMKCYAKKGKIVAPFKFDTEETTGSGRQKRLVKSYKNGSDNRQFFISTGTGKAIVKK